MTERQWLRALDDLVVIPDGFRDESAGRDEALATLRCGEAVLDALVAAGLPCDDEQRFDRFDLFNLALYSGSGRSMPEMAFQFALRWMASPADSWFAPRRWRFDVGIACGRADGCGAEPSWSIARPRVGIFSADPVDARIGPTAIELNGGTGLRIAGIVETTGRRAQLRSPELRERIEAFMHAGYRWVRMPEALQRRPELVLPHGVSNCITACVVLERELRAAGYEVRTRRGWMLGMLDIEHAWLEILDCDGEIKVVDPVFALLAGHATAANPELETAVIGSRINRVLPTDNPAERALTGHVCGGAEARVRKRTEIRPERQELAA